jgi:hypothetical protein
MEQDIAAKETDVLEGAASRPVGSTLLGATRDIENREAAKAIGTSSVAGQRVTDALDEINKLHSTLAGHGLRTTGLSSQAGALGIQALSLVPKNPKLSEALGVGAAGAAVYGGLTQPTTAPNKLSIAPLSATQFSGSDISTIAPNIYTDQQAAAATSGAASAFNMGPY